MKIENSTLTIKEQLKNKETKLERIASSALSNSEKTAVQERIISNVSDFIDELEEVRNFLDFGLNVKLVSKPIFEKQVAKADFASMEYNGKYCKVALIQNYSADNFWLVYVAAVESIK